MAGSAATDVVVVGTAGHIDHGKSTLVRTLTGVDPDTLPEERERGITIALGFAPLNLPDGRTIAFVDVPGHERLVRTMVSGATGIDAAVLCVSAVDGVMPQTREHLAILGLLGVSRGFVVLTFADQVDADYLELARADVEELVRGSFLESAPIFPWSAPTGTGRDAVLAELCRLRPRERAASGPFRMPVDRVFVRTGFGTVVTGTAWSGAVRDGDAATVHPGAHPVRIRGMQCHGRAVSDVGAGRRVALNLSGIDRANIDRGAVIVAGPVAQASMLDVRYVALPGAPPLEDGEAVRVLHGTAERIGRFHRLDGEEPVEPGASAWAQLRLEAPLVCWPGDRFVVRRPSPQETLGGGVIVDPWATRHRRRDAAGAVAALERLNHGEAIVFLERAGDAGWLAREWDERAGGPGPVALADRVYAPSVVDAWETAFRLALDAFHTAHRLAPGAQRRELRRGRLAGLPDRTFDALLERLAASGRVVIDGAVVRRADFAVHLDPASSALVERIRATIASVGLEGAAWKRLTEAHPEPDAGPLVQWLEARGEVENVPDIGYIAHTSLHELAARVVGWFAAHDELNPAAFKDLTGLSRKSAIPLLEWLDRTKVTRRRGDVRVRYVDPRSA